MFVAFTDCSEEALESMGDRLLDWFSVVMADTQKRKLNRRNRSNQGSVTVAIYYTVSLGYSYASFELYIDYKGKQA